MAALRVFISHASIDSVFAERLATDLRSAGADVWLDSSHLTGPGDFVARISQALNERDVLILVLSPAAIASQWVPDEMNAAIVRAKQGYMRPPLVVQCADVPLRDIPGLWTTYQRIDATSDYGSALKRVDIALGLTSPAPAYTPPAPPPISVVSPVKPDGPLKATPLPNRPSLTPRKPLPTVSLRRVSLLFGVTLAAVLFLVDQTTLGLLFLPIHIGNLLAGVVIRYVVILSAAFIVGFRTYGRAQRIRDGLLAGMWVVLIAVTLDIIADSLLFVVRIREFTPFHSTTDWTLSIIGLAIVFGLVAGALGGLVARWRAKA